jgi:hypothetical protein
MFRIWCKLITLYTAVHARPLRIISISWYFHPFAWLSHSPSLSMMIIRTRTEIHYPFITELFLASSTQKSSPLHPTKRKRMHTNGHFSNFPLLKCLYTKTGPNFIFSSGKCVNAVTLFTHDCLVALHAEMWTFTFMNAFKGWIPTSLLAPYESQRLLIFVCTLMRNIKKNIIQLSHILN